MNQKCIPLCMLMNINSRRVYAIFSKCFLLRFFYKETFQSKYVSTFDTFVKIVPTTFKKLLSLFLKFAKNDQLKCFVVFFFALVALAANSLGLFNTCEFQNSKRGSFFGEPLLVSLLICKKRLQVFPLGSLINLVFFQNTEIFAGNILKPFDTVLNLVSTSTTKTRCFKNIKIKRCV